MLELKLLVPSDKIETDKAIKLVELGFPAVEPVLPEILEWLQDMNWPVAQVFAPFLADIGSPLAPYIKPILDTTDEVWKGWMLFSVIGKSPAMAKALIPELARIATYPTQGEIDENLHSLAGQVLQRLAGQHNE